MGSLYNLKGDCMLNKMDIGARIKEIELKIVEIQDKTGYDDLRKELSNLRDEASKQKKKFFIGKCYKTDNCYSGGEHWTLYVKIIGADSISLESLNVQKDCYGKIRIEESSTYLSSTYEEISNKEFQKELKKMIAEIKSLAR